MAAYAENITDAHLAELLRNGFVSLPSLVGVADLDSVADNVIAEIEGNAFTELSDSHRQFVDWLGLRDEFASRLFSLARKNFGFRGRVTDQYHVARFVNPGNSRECFRSHFDSHLFTLVLPISIPTNVAEYGSGELVFVPRARRHPRNEIENFVTKSYFKRYASERAVRRLLESDECRIESFREMRPVMFLGMTTLHTNFPVLESASKPRLTLLAHYFDPAPNMGVGSVLRLIRNR